MSKCPLQPSSPPTPFPVGGGRSRIKISSEVRDRFCHQPGKMVGGLEGPFIFFLKYYKKQHATSVIFDEQLKQMNPPTPPF